jgi:uncharacterized protein YkwD
MAVKLILASMIVCGLLGSGIIHSDPQATAASTQKDEPFSKLVEAVHQQVNDFRREHGLEPLKLHPAVSAQAREHSAEMARNADGISHRGFDERLKDIRQKLSFRAAAENVATIRGFENPAQQVVEGWARSADHRKNMLGEYSLTGIGVARSKEGAYFVTQMFVNP